MMVCEPHVAAAEVAFSLLRLSAAYSQRAESFLSGSNANFLEAQYLDWAKTKGAIDPSWDGFYDSLTGPTLKIEELEDEFSPTTVSK
ncbi:hypothetical protein MSG28_003688 [Choristoneura fumiferana]|uniref:Uncharacterized protein n=1 Tax=Choristoneura fumiferana TaxID=7141 RepID=A0ACC0KG70_CHOFU|nr:hypothetical protein MSG28_003688 [Choristoneura fumiferana]